MLKEAGVKLPIRYAERGHLYAPGYLGRNYISLFWGDKDGNFKKNLTKSEIAGIEQELREPAAPAIREPDVAAIRAGCEKVSKDLKALIRIRVDGVEKQVTKEDYIEAKTKQMVEFGYRSLTEDHISQQLELVLAGKMTMAEGLTVIGMFIKQDVVM